MLEHDMRMNFFSGYQHDMKNVKVKSHIGWMDYDAYMCQVSYWLCTRWIRSSIAPLTRCLVFFIIVNQGQTELTGVPGPR